MVISIKFLWRQDPTYTEHFFIQITLSLDDWYIYDNTHAQTCNPYYSIFCTLALSTFFRKKLAEAMKMQITGEKQQFS